MGMGMRDGRGWDGMGICRIGWEEEVGRIADGMG